MAQIKSSDLLRRTRGGGWGLHEKRKQTTQNEMDRKAEVKAETTEGGTVRSRIYEARKYGDKNEQREGNRSTKKKNLHHLVVSVFSARV